MTGFTAPPSTTDSTTPPSKCVPGQDFYYLLGGIYDVTYTANMAYADFYPELLNEHQCIKYAVAVANDKDGYIGIQFCRWVADVVGKKENIDWDKFK